MHSSSHFSSQLQRKQSVVRARELTLRDVVCARDLALLVFPPAKHSASHDHQN